MTSGILMMPLFHLLRWNQQCIRIIVIFSDIKKVTDEVEQLKKDQTGVSGITLKSNTIKQKLYISD